MQYCLSCSGGMNKWVVYSEQPVLGVGSRKNRQGFEQLWQRLNYIGSGMQWLVATKRGPRKHNHWTGDRVYASLSVASVPISCQHTQFLVDCWLRLMNNVATVLSEPCCTPAKAPMMGIWASKLDHAGMEEGGMVWWATIHFLHHVDAWLHVYL